MINKSLFAAVLSGAAACIGAAVLALQGRIPAPVAASTALVLSVVFLALYKRRSLYNFPSPRRSHFAAVLSLTAIVVLTDILAAQGRIAALSAAAIALLVGGAFFAIWAFGGARSLDLFKVAIPVVGLAALLRLMDFTGKMTTGGNYSVFRDAIGPGLVIAAVIAAGSFIFFGIPFLLHDKRSQSLLARARQQPSLIESVRLKPLEAEPARKVCAFTLRGEKETCIYNSDGASALYEELTALWRDAAQHA